MRRNDVGNKRSYVQSKVRDKGVNNGQYLGCISSVEIQSVDYKCISSVKCKGLWV